MIDHLVRESARFREILAAADPRARVPSCPDWDAEDLLWHLTEVQHFWASVVEERLTSGDDVRRFDRPEGVPALLGAFDSCHARLVEALRSTPPETEVYMWAEDKTVGYIARRQAHEALIHRLDAELATDQVTPLDPDLAADGVVEIFQHMYGGAPPWGTFTPEAGTLLHLDCTDVGRVVPVTLGRFTGTDPDSGTSYDEDDLGLAEPGDPRATIRGTADDLDAWLWHRRGDDTLTFEGDDAVLERLRALLSQPLN